MALNKFYRTPTGYPNPEFTLTLRGLMIVPERRMNFSVVSQWVSWSKCEGSWI